MNYNEEDLLEVELVLESEWHKNSINDDFQKLLLARANLRAFIFQSKDDKQYKNLIADLKRQIQGFSRSATGDKYLFSCWIYNEEQRFVHDVFSYKSIDT